MSRAITPPIACATMNAGTDAGATPASVLEDIRPIEIARLAKPVELVELVNE
jgi:hypothetical protein